MFNPFPRRWLIIASLFLLSACNTFPGLNRSDDRPANDSPPSDAPSTLTQPQPTLRAAEYHQRIDALVTQIQSDLDGLEAGSQTPGEQDIQTSMQSLDELALACRLLEDCDYNHLFAAYQSIVIAQQELFLGANRPASAEGIEPLNDTFDEPPATDQLTSSLQTGNQVDMSIDGSWLDRQQVLESMNNWLTWNRPHLMNTHENYRHLRAQMWPAFEERGLPESLLFGIMATESGGRVHSYSSAGAAGPMQFMRATGSRFGLGNQSGYDDRLNPELAGRAAAAYLVEQYQALGQDLTKTLAAYNAGENRLKRLNRQHNQADFWSSNFYYALPRDTRKYVPDVLAAAWLFDHAADYKLAFDDQQAQSADLTLQHPASLGELTICLGNDRLAGGWFRTLRNLNPGIKAGERIDVGNSIRATRQIVDDYAQRCSDEQIRISSEAMHVAAYEDKPDVAPYRIRSGDTMSGIARRYRCVSMKELASMNNIAGPRYTLRAGKSIKVPSC